MSTLPINQPAFFKANTPFSGGDVPFDARPEDLEESVHVESYLKSTCGCTLNLGSPCSSLFTNGFVSGHRNDATSLQAESPESFNMLLAGFYCANRRVCNKEKTALWKIDGTRVCADFFAFMHACSTWKLNNIIKHVNEFGYSGWCSSRLRRNDPKRVEKTLTGINDVKNYLEGRMMDDAVALPGRCPSHSEFKAVRFPSHYTKKLLYDQYKASCESRGDDRTISYSSFLRYWESGCPHIGIMGPSSDLCDLCRAHMKVLGELAAIPDGEEKDLKKEAEYGTILNHLASVRSERAAYSMAVQKAKAAYASDPNAPEVVMVDFDYAECKTFPFFSAQPGPLHFMSRRKGNMFGIHNEGEGKSAIYLYDEEETSTIGKGANAVISMVYHYLGNYVGTARTLHLQCDNCSGQNKNWIMTSFLGWLTWTQQSPDIKLNFMVENHSKFAPDRTFGLISKSFLRSDAVESIHDMPTVCTRASSSIQPILVNDYVKENSRLVNWYKFDAFLKPMFQPIPNVKKYHSFRFSRENPGVVMVKEWSTCTEEIAINIVKRGFNARQLPREIPSSYIPTNIPLTPARCWYMYDNLRKFCTSIEKMDLLAPLPTVPRPTANSTESREFRQTRVPFEITLENEDENGHRINIEVPEIPAIDVCPEESDDDESMEFLQNGDPENEVVNEITTSLSTQSLDEYDDVLNSTTATETSTSEAATWNKNKRCGECNPCLLYAKYENGLFSKNQSGVPRFQRLKCGSCRSCRKKWKETCVNVKCINR